MLLFPEPPVWPKVCLGVNVLKLSARLGGRSGRRNFEI